MKLNTYKEYLKYLNLDEETVSADIANVDSRLGSNKKEVIRRPKRCKKHSELQCEICKSK